MSNVSAIIHSAISGKYGDHPLAEVEERCRRVLDALERQPEASFPTTVDWETDVANQVRCFHLIETAWRNRPPPTALESIHAAVYGLDTATIEYRTTEHVEDFGGRVPVSATEVSARLETLNDMLQQAPALAHASLADQAAFLANMFVSIIRTHPFADGNGRTARMVVQYCLALWNRDYIEIPKVRNDLAWKAALSAGVHGGDIEQARNWFLAALKAGDGLQP